MSAGADLLVDQAPDDLSRLLDVQARAVLLLAARPRATEKCQMVSMRALDNLRRALEASTPGSVEAVREALAGGG